jgi:aminoglycoside/choline kinase family phosphotransferase
LPNATGWRTSSSGTQTLRTRNRCTGDASLSNLLAAADGPRWNDFEDVCVGPVEWDVAGVSSDARDRYGDAYRTELLAAYGNRCDPDARARIDEVHALYGTLWRRYHRRTLRR